MQALGGSGQGRRVLIATAIALSAFFSVIAATNAQAQLAQMRDLSLTKTDSPDPVQVNGLLTYTLTATNNNGGLFASASGVTVVDQLPDGVDFVSASSSCTETASEVTCLLGTIGPLKSKQATIVVRPLEANPALVNTATVRGNQLDPDPTDNDASATTLVDVLEPDLAVSKSASPDPVPVGGLLTYTLTATNVAHASDGVDDATGVELEDPLPAEVSFVSASSGCIESGGVVSCQIGSLQEGTSAVRQIVVQTQVDGTVENTVSISGDQPDPAPENDSDSVATQVDFVLLPAVEADLGVAVIDSADPVGTGAKLTYQVLATNFGPSPAAQTVLTHDVPSDAELIGITPGCSEESFTVTCSLGAMPVNDVKSFFVQVRAPADPTDLFSSVSISSETDDSNFDNNFDDEQTAVLHFPQCLGKTTTILGSDDADRISGTGRPDVISGLGGADRIRSLAGNDLVCGGPDDDRMQTGNGADRLLGGGGDDNLGAGGGDDRLQGGSGSDFLSGQDGNDLLFGQGSHDQMSGGRGLDFCDGGLGGLVGRACESGA